MRRPAGEEAGVRGDTTSAPVSQSAAITRVLRLNETPFLTSAGRSGKSRRAQQGHVSNS